MMVFKDIRINIHEKFFNNYNVNMDLNLWGDVVL